MGESHTRETNVVQVDTSLDTHLLVVLHRHETISDFKVNLCKDHLQCFPKLGEIDISAVKVTRQNPSGLLLDYCMPDSTLLSRVLDGIGHDCWSVFVDAAVKVEKRELPGENCLNHELLLENGSLELEEDLEAEKTRKKRELELSSDGEKSRKKTKVDLNQSAAAITDVDECHELHGNVHLEVVATESSPSKKLQETTREETEMGEKSVEDVGRVNADTDDLVTHQANHLDSSSGLTTRSEDDINQSSAAALTTSNVESVAAAPESLPASGGDNHGNPFAEASQKDDLVSHHLDTNIGLTARPDTEKKSSEDDTNQTSATANVEERVDAATPAASFPISRGENLDDSFAEAIQKENELVQIFIDDVGRDQTETDNHLDTVNEVTTRPVTEKKKRRKKRSKDAIISQSFSASITTSRDIVNEIGGVPSNVDSVDATLESLPISRRENPSTEASHKETETGENSGGPMPLAGGARATACFLNFIVQRSKHAEIEKNETEENNASLEVADSQELSDEVNNAAMEETPLMKNPQDTENLDDSFAEAIQKENELVQISIDDVGRGQIETDIHTSNYLDTVSAVTARPVTEKKKGRKKRSKDAIISQSFSASITTSSDIVKRKTKKSKTPAEEDTLVVSSEAHNVEPIKAVEGEEPDNIIRNVTGSLQENNASLEVADSQELSVEVNNASLEVAQSQELSVEVNNDAMEETPLMNNPQDTESDASLLRKCSEVADDAADKSLSKTSPIEKADIGDNFGSSQNHEKPEQVAGGAKSKKKEKKGLDLHPSGSSNCSLSSLKRKDKKNRAQQPASSSTDHLQSRVPNKTSDVCAGNNLDRTNKFSESL
ncbi:COP1-interacting protein 4.1 [Raphanus sativus]|uniref:Uncharacterized protein LOC108808063 isoform X2 n=1 Tax=Raphanus sativus TaxID=3726 RepID=A0A6J0JL90_RAPSA|nr:uncharacterized protein LOC108808063 isoform X2 [Raphanus sativus]KAJ4871714.1 COP1-interacting protein 4.1 [Raphanus sativus]